jgi:transketolase N-terminal domain/subunit
MMDEKLSQRLLDICYRKQLHHLGSYFSCLDLIDKIYSEMSEDDIFILSNGHAVVSLYVVLEKYFGFNAEELL